MNKITLVKVRSNIVSTISFDKDCIFMNLVSINKNSTFRCGKCWASVSPSGIFRNELNCVLTCKEVSPLDVTDKCPLYKLKFDSPSFISETVLKSEISRMSLFLSRLLNKKDKIMVSR